MRRISNKLYNDIREIEANTSEVWPKSIIVIRLTRMYSVNAESALHYKIKRLFICRFQ